jgi:hypothetical protein
MVAQSVRRDAIGFDRHSPHALSYRAARHVEHTSRTGRLILGQCFDGWWQAAYLDLGSTIVVAMGKCVTGPVKGGKPSSAARISWRTGEFSAAVNAAALSNTTLLRCICRTRGQGSDPRQSIQVYISICLMSGKRAMMGG